MAVQRHDAGPKLSIEQAFQAVTSGNLKSEDVAVMKELLAMDAERKFTAAFVALQSELPGNERLLHCARNDIFISSIHADITFLHTF